MYKLVISRRKNKNSKNKCRESTQILQKDGRSPVVSVPITGSKQKEQSLFDCGVF